MANKTLIVLRHAKSSWEDPSLDDFDRPLNDRGRRDAPVMAERLAGRRAAKPVIVTSPATRAMTTAAEFARAFGINENDMVVYPDIYDASRKTLVALINGFSADWDSVLLVGHNPGLTTLVNELAGAGIDNLPTCAVAEIALEVDDWRAVGKATGVLAEYDYPKKKGGESG